MTQKLIGVHVFEKSGPIEWEPLLASIQLISALSWKMHHGRIELYANSEWLDVLRGYGIDQAYDSINIIEPENADSPINRSIYWAWPKMRIARNLTANHVMLDTDLWINSPIEIDESCDFMGFHEETWSSSNPTNPYPDFDQIIDKADLGRWDKAVNPVNCALLWINNPSLLNEWLTKAEEIVVSTGEGRIADPKQFVHQVFVEQRLLPMIAKERSLRYKTFLPIVYQSHVMDMGMGECWIPEPDSWSIEILEKVKSFIHIWGCKKMWTYDDAMRNYHCNMVCTELKKYWRKFNVEPAIQGVLRMQENYTPSSESV